MRAILRLRPDKCRVNTEDGDMIEVVTILKGLPDETPPSKDYLAVIRQGLPGTGD